jgi:hypothetical protein
LENTRDVHKPVQGWYAEFLPKIDLDLSTEKNSNKIELKGQTYISASQQLTCFNLKNKTLKKAKRQ